jgi:phosphatidate cytidylyltransferase
LAPDVSPGKTLEGFLGGVAASVLVAVLLLGMIAPWDADIMDRLLLGLVLGCIGPLGDLSASMVKRELGVKDFGALLPEHGGVLDRFDAMLFALPVTYYLSVVFILN